jgi:hypothetical protein
VPASARAFGRGGQLCHAADGQPGDAADERRLGRRAPSVPVGIQRLVPVGARRDAWPPRRDGRVTLAAWRDAYVTPA